MNDCLPLVFLAFVAGLSLGLCLATRRPAPERARVEEEGEWWQRGEEMPDYEP